MSSFNWGLRLVTALSAAALCSACGGSDSDGPGGGGSGLLTQAPHCPTGTDALRIEGTLDGATVDDQRSTNINAGLSNFGESSFDTPFSNLAALQPSELEIHLEWMGSLFFGQTGPTTGGSVVAPSGAAHAGQTLCVSAGSVGFAKGGSEDGVFKFQVTELRAGADCTGDVVPAELRGCFE
ncbi:MAG TPA: hypothetical protein VG937_09635 [Polyangiaceae bacterium]|nr:hypothetical protein [Polyangiaceae bacterium]